VRKLWTARILFALAAAGLAAVVFEEHREQVAEDEPVKRISAPAGQHQAFEVDTATRRR
jgi:hypothetical protein